MGDTWEMLLTFLVDKFLTKVDKSTIFRKLIYREIYDLAANIVRQRRKLKNRVENSGAFINFLGLGREK